jgi:hypothetical protein
MEWSAALWRAPGKLMKQIWAGLWDNLSFCFQEIHDLDLTHALNFPRVLTPQDLIPPNLLRKWQMPSDNFISSLETFTNRSHPCLKRISHGGMKGSRRSKNIRG